MLLGGYCTQQHRGFLVRVDNREANTLLPLVQLNIAAGSVIHSDSWASYRQVANIPVHPPYTHGTVNHSQNFVDPVTGVHTNAVEGFWSRAKDRLKQYHGVPDSTLDSHLDEFLWREIHGKEGGMATLDNMLQHLAQWRPLP